MPSTVLKAGVYGSEQNRYNPCPHKADILVGGDTR